MIRRLLGVGLAAAVAAGGSGCVGGGPKAAPGGPPVAIGPEAAGRNPPAELPPKEAAAACLASAQELDRNGKGDEAVALYERARRLDPGQGKKAARRLAVLYDRRGEFGKADAEYEAAVEQAPKDADLLNDVGYSHYCRGDWAKAEEYLTRATAAAPAHKRAWTNLGLAVGMQGRAAEALGCFLKAVPEPEARCNAAFVLAARGQTDEARAEYRRALALAPDLPVARAALEKLGGRGPAAGVAGAGPAADPRPGVGTPPADDATAPVVIDPAAVRR